MKKSHTQLTHATLALGKQARVSSPQMDTTVPDFSSSDAMPSSSF